MDMTVERAKFESVLAEVPDHRVRAGLLEQFEELAAKHDAAQDPVSKACVESTLAQLHRAATVAMRARRDMSGYFYTLIGVVIFLCFFSLWAYFWGIGAQRYTQIDATRPVLVFTLIIAMLGFGGTLIFQALYSSEAPDEATKRFRLAREIFLVYTGIFGTIIGFYFGAASGETVTEPPTLAAPTIQSDGLVLVNVSKGSSPYSGSIRLVGETEDRTLAASGARLTVQLTPRQDCPAAARITARDKDARTAEITVAQTAADLLTQGWEGCRARAGAADGQQSTARNEVVPPTPPAGPDANGQ